MGVLREQFYPLQRSLDRIGARENDHDQEPTTNSTETGHEVRQLAQEDAAAEGSCEEADWQKEMTQRRWRSMNQIEIYTIGHSNHAIDQFVALLKQREIEALVDVRRFPSSRRLPHFNRLNMAATLEQHGIEYHWLESLGGHRKEGLGGSPNLGIRDEAFRNYADHMLGDEFRDGADRLLAIAETKQTAIMCAEKSFHECHRKLTSDFLFVNGISVQHILATGEVEPHQLSAGATASGGNVTYPESHPLFD